MASEEEPPGRNLPVRDGCPRSDRTVKIEIDAARTLAEFALLESEHGRQHDPAVSLRRDECRGDVKDKHFFLDLNQHAYVLEEQLQQQGNNVAAEMKLQSPEDSHTFKIGLDCSSGSQFPLSGYRAKHSLTEAEKEDKRLRRILANRESARQTIRRRQAFREELTRKADSLSKDNEILKKEKERMLREYLLLKDINRQLKWKIAERLKVGVEDSPTQMSSTRGPSPSSTINDQLCKFRL